MLYFFTKSTQSAGGSRHRAFFVAEFLKQKGYDSTIVIPPAHRTDVSRNQARREYLKRILLLRKKDIVFLQNPIFSTYFIVLICFVKVLFRPTLIFDFDDATWVQNPIAPRVMALFSDKYIVASHYLAQWKPLQGKPVMIMPNLVDYTRAERYVVKREPSTVVVGWIGSGPVSFHNIEILIEVFKELVRRGAHVTFKLVVYLERIQVTLKKTGMEEPN